MPTAGAASRRVPGRQFVPLSVFFLQIQGEEGGEDEGEQVTGLADKKAKPKKGLGQLTFPDNEKAQTRAMKGPRPKPKKKGPLPTTDGGEMGEEREGTTRFTGTASKPQACRYCKAPAVKSLIWADGRAYVPVCADHESKARDKIVNTNRDEVVYVRKIDEDTTTANVAAYPVPLGRPLRRVTRKRKGREWIDRLAKSMATT